MLAFVMLAAAVTGCAARHKAKAPAVSQSNQAATAAAANPAAESSPSAKVSIDYARPDDFIRTVTVTKFTAAHAIPIRHGEERAGTSIVRFEGGVPVWEFHADEGLTRRLLTEMPLIRAGSKFRLRSVTYGALPRNFLQTVPDSGPPEPLETDSYYVFEVERASGATSFEAVKVEADGTIEGYDAQPRAGDSYALCCNVNADFASSASP